MTLIGFTVLASKNFRNRLEIVDMYTTKHNHKLLVPMYIKKTSLGGFFTLLYIFAAIVFVTISLMKYSMVNLTQYSTLVPLITTENQVKISSNMVFEVMLDYYQGNCGSGLLCLEDVLVTFDNIEGGAYYYCKKIEQECYLKIVCNTCAVDKSATINIIFSEDISYSSTISVNLSSSSSIPNQNSSYQGVVQSSSNSFFTGEDPTIFEFTLIPTVFSSSGYNSSGYYVSMDTKPVLGSQSSYLDFSPSSRLLLQINLVTSNTCLTISRELSVGMLELFSALIGTIFGMMSSFGGILNISEKYIESFKTWHQHKFILNSYKSRILKLMRIINIDKEPLSSDTTCELGGLTKDLDLDNNSLNKEIA